MREKWWNKKEKKGYAWLREFSINVGYVKLNNRYILHHFKNFPEPAGLSNLRE